MYFLIEIPPPRLWNGHYFSCDRWENRQLGLNNMPKVTRIVNGTFGIETGPCIILWTSKRLKRRARESWSHLSATYGCFLWREKQWNKVCQKVIADGRGRTWKQRNTVRYDVLWEGKWRESYVSSSFSTDCLPAQVYRFYVYTCCNTKVACKSSMTQPWPHLRPSHGTGPLF